MSKLKTRIISTALALTATSATSIANPSDLKVTEFAGSDVAPSPACLSVAANGDVYVGVDLLGSLGKGSGKGRIVKLVDTDNDGKADKHTVFAKVDNPRGLISMGDKLYVLHTVIPDGQKLTGMHLSVLTDADHDGVADGEPKRLIENISVPKHNQDRGADHTTNGIRMGIDGWIYIAVGDFGFVDAVGTDGKKLTMLGGGILRVRPDGSNMEVYTHGLRNIYDVAIDPFMNMYTRGNTNDGGGWNVRFIHQIQSGEYGYPVLFKHFTSEIIPALADLGGGSGTGALFMDEPTWPDKYNKVPMMADWGRNEIYIHRLTQDGPSFTQKQEDFINTSQPADVDVDGSGRMFIAAWAGAGYKGNPKRGYIQLVTPQNWQYKAFPELTKLSDEALVKGLRSDSATTRLNVQQELIKRDSKKAAGEIIAIAQDTKASKESRVAAIFTYKQLLGKDANKALLDLADDTDVQEWTIRALADRLDQVADLPLEPFYEALKSSNPRVQVAAAVALGRIGKKEAAPALLAVAKPPASEKDDEGTKTATAFFTSEKVTGKKVIDIDIDITRTKQLCLIVEDGGDGNGGDHAAWIDPTLITESGKKVPLNKLKWKSATQGWGKTLKGKDTTGKPLQLVDGTKVKDGIGTHSKSVITYKIPPQYVRFQAKAGLSSGANESASVKFALSATPPSGSGSPEGPHATPNSPVILPHVAVHALVNLGAKEDCLDAIDSESQDGALWALHLMHDETVVNALISKFKGSSDAKLKNKILRTLARLYTKEAPYDGSWWWKTQPDTRGPYYVPVTWEASLQIEELFRTEWESATPDHKGYLTFLANKYRMNLQGIGKVEDKVASKEKKIGDMSIEDVMLGLDKAKGNVAKGKKLMSSQACIACHSISANDRKLGPDLNAIGGHLDREAIAEAILKPDATIADAWVDVVKTDGSSMQGTLVSKDDKELVVRNIAGISTTVPMSEVKSVGKSASTIMGPHLLDALTMKEFADVIEYLHSLK
ncbi:putative heme-binding domain-containing protein [Rubritalea squalenifaciens DSM 18772]|uniref:Putative heme-binding domain-containing protein n=1 Tax=Rubritalea squalenifaciens DSM 18772 TaxID=1123071 RepID=A0A1M6IDK0_9BACT|nr:NPCBM/NEW2 domain-containing protein [Rubritalea squalenifaciens]SHJ32524.1 putative heme-binding domain-containing protein [Rubritalea squalenifaciens DSM 18772]